LARAGDCNSESPGRGTGRSPEWIAGRSRLLQGRRRLAGTRALGVTVVDRQRRDTAAALEAPTVPAPAGGEKGPTRREERAEPPLARVGRGDRPAASRAPRAVGQWPEMPRFPSLDSRFSHAFFEAVTVHESMLKNVQRESGRELTSWLL